MKLLAISLASKDGVSIKVVSDTTPQYFEDDDFLTDESLVILDFNTALGGRNATDGFIVCDGPGSIKVEFSLDGVSFDDLQTIKKKEIYNFSNLSVNSIRITWVSDSAYRVSVI